MSLDVDQSSLPSGTVTFLFTDIEGSTRLLQRLKDEYESILAKQREILRAAFIRWDGAEVDTQGDAFFVAFPRTTDAVSAVVEIQRGLAQHKWPSGAIVRVRMALHTGEAALKKGGYIGMDVHRAARICAAGHGGQILLSKSTCSIVERDVSAGLTIRALGKHQL